MGAGAPRSSFIRLENSRLFKKLDNRSVWSITCLFVDKNYRRKSLSIKLIREATSFAFNHGTSIVEAYPIIPKINEIVKVSSEVEIDEQTMYLIYRFFSDGYPTVMEREEDFIVTKEPAFHHLSWHRIPAE